MVTVSYSSNNSGGRWWLKDEDWDKLAEAGWNVVWVHDPTDWERESQEKGDKEWAEKHGKEPRGISWLTDRDLTFICGEGNDLRPVEWNGERWLGAKAKEAHKEFEDPAAAIAEFEKVTGQDASAEGCNCCGPPHGFEYRDVDGELHFARARVTKTEIGFD